MTKVPHMKPNQNEIFKKYPILSWNAFGMYQYLPKNQLPYHSLEGVECESLGDWHSTKKISEVEFPEDSRDGVYDHECGF